MNKLLIHKRLTKVFQLSSLFFLFVFSSCVSNKLFTTSNWQDEIKHDNKTMVNYEFIMIPGSNVLFRTANNDKILQVQIKFVKESMVRNVMMNGLDVWIDVSAKQKKNAGVQFPSVKTALRGLKPVSGKEFDPSMLVNSINLYGANLLVNGSTSRADKQIATVYLDENKDLNYIITIPFSIIGTTYLKDKKISVGIMSERIEKEARPGSDNDVDRPEGGGMMQQGSQYGGSNLGEGGSGGGGRMSGMGPQGNSAGRPEMMMTLNTWINVSLPGM